MAKSTLDTKAFEKFIDTNSANDLAPWLKLLDKECQIVRLCVMFKGGETMDLDNRKVKSVLALKKKNK
jgi:hypothetical protein